MVKDIVRIHQRRFLKYWKGNVWRFQKVGYREGITTGKEAALQEGFDAGFADTGAPIGRELGILRGMSSAILALLLRSSTIVNEKESTQAEAREISSQLLKIRFSDIMPRDLEAEEHARQHLEEGVEIDVHEKIAATRDIEGIEDMLANLGTNFVGTTRPSVDDVRILKNRLKVLSDRLNLQVDI